MRIPVVIFCGGQGTRMKEETEFRPKPMVTIGGKPILWHIMKIYSHYGYNRFIICLGYKGDYIKDYFLNEDYFTHDLTINTLTGKRNIHRKSRKKHDDFSITFADTGLNTQTGERLLMVRRYIKNDNFMVTYGDGVGNINIPELIHLHNKKKFVGTITGVHPKSKWGLIVSDKNNTIQSFEQKPQLNQYVNGGFMIFNQKFFKFLRANESIEEGFDRLIKKGGLGVYTHSGYWAAMDTYQDVEYLNKQWENAPKWKIWQ